MNRLSIAFLCGVLVLASSMASAQNTLRVRGTISDFDGTVLSVKSREGENLKLQLTESTTVSYPKAVKLSEIKPGDYIGTTATPDSEGRLVAREVHLFAETARGSGEGHFSWDMEPRSTMTNANLTKMVTAANGQELTLEYKDGTQKILVPEGVPVVTAVPGDRSLLQPGVYVFISVRVAADGSMTATRIQASKDEIKPPM